MTTATPRRYDSSRRREAAADTRRSVLDAAARLFAEKGWAGTSMKDVAAEARVSVETIYSSVGNKTELLKVALDVAVVGDDAPLPLVERPEFLVLGRGTLEERAAALGRMLAAMYSRTAPLHRALDHAAVVDEELAALSTTLRGPLRESFVLGGRALTGRDLTEDEVDTLVACHGNEVYLLLTETLGWSADKYAAWVADTVIRLLGLREEQE